MMAATLANGGLNPVSGVRTSHQHVRQPPPRTRDVRLPGQWATMLECLQSQVSVAVSF